ncbi:MAG: hypothetical protein H0U22_14870 [Geodermatophilaceae bacterium]|nr:hypothetical protein [Geodermatophilaceae bacterium]
MPDYDYDDQITLTRGDLVPAVLILEGLVEALELLGGRWAREKATDIRDVLGELSRGGGAIPEAARLYAGGEWAAALLHAFPSRSGQSPSYQL